MTKKHNRKGLGKQIVSSGSDRVKPPNILKILVVDDDEGIGDILNEYLSWCGHNLKVVNNGTDAIGLIVKEGFDLVLTDLIMPKVSGFDLIKFMNELDKRPKIGLVTGSGDKLKIVIENGLNVDFIIRKPFNLSEIAEKINNLFKTA